jgi:hypothetical protein
MATKKTETPAAKAKPDAAKKTAKAGSKAAPKAKAASKAKSGPKAKAAPTGPRHPRGQLLARYGSKESLASTLAASLARPDEDTEIIAARLKTASNRQLLGLASVTETVKKKWGTREKLIAAIGTATKKGKDKDDLAMLDTYSLPRLVELATSAERRARA